MKAAPRHLGISFYQRRIQIAEVEQSKQPLVTGMTEAECPLDIIAEGSQLTPEHPAAASLATAIGAMITRSKLTGGSVSFALPTAPLLIHTLPLDPALKEEELKEQLFWEVRQYFPNAAEGEFLVDVHFIPWKEKVARRAFLVGVRRAMVGFFRHVAAQLKRPLRIVDVDHFSSEKTFVANYPEAGKHAAVLFGLRNHVVDASTVTKGETIHYRAYGVSSFDELPKVVADYLNLVREEYEKEKIATVYLHGIDVDASVSAALRSHTRVNAVPLNAFKKLAAGPAVPKPLLKESHRFAASIGVALRKT